MRRVSCFVLVAAVGAVLGLSDRTAAQEPRGFLGVTVAPADGGRGVIIKDVTADSPAARAGLKVGDRVVKVGDQDVKDAEAFVKTVSARKPGDKLAMTVQRDGKEQTLTATLGERPGSVARQPELPLLPPGGSPAFLGVNVQPLTAELRKQLKVDVEEGVVVTEVIPKSPAEKAGLKRDDVITAVGGHPVKGPEDLREQVQKAGPGKELTLAVARGGEKLTLKATPRAGAFGSFVVPGDERFPFPEVGSMSDQGRRIRELERRVDELERRLKELEAKSGKPK